MVAYNKAVVDLMPAYAPSTIYSALYLVFIPLSHAMLSLFVFGWPDKYLSSLLSNFPIGLSALAIGGLLTAYLDRVNFNETIEELIVNHWTFTHMPPRRLEGESEETTSSRDEFYSSIVVLSITSIWTYLLSLYVNLPAGESSSHQKVN
jgi:hypothetical protein